MKLEYLCDYTATFITPIGVLRLRPATLSMHGTPFVLSVASAKSKDRRVPDPDRYTPHPSPLPQGERG